jgi:hypothetical protein
MRNGPVFPTTADATFAITCLYYYMYQYHVIPGVWLLTLELGEEGEVQRLLNQKLGLKLFETVDFASRFVIITESMNFKLRIH